MVTTSDSSMRDSESPNGADETSDRTSLPLFMLVHQDNTPAWTSSQGHRVFDFMAPVIHYGLFDSTTVLIRAEFSVTLFRIHKQLLELKFIHYPVSYGFLPLFDEPVYTMSTFSDFDVARLVKWAYDGEYPEYLDLDSPTRTRMPTSRYSSLDEYLRKQIRTPRISSLNSTINISSDRHLVPCRQKRPTAYNLSQQQQAFITNNFPFLVHLRMYVLASLYELPSLQKQAQDLGRKCCRAYLDGNWDLQMQKDRDLLCGDIRDLATQIPRDDPVRHLIAIVLKCNEVG